MYQEMIHYVNLFLNSGEFFFTRTSLEARQKIPTFFIPIGVMLQPVSTTSLADWPVPAPA
jgi:hypothetical protein